MQENATSLLELLGLICILVASFAVDWRVGLALLGVILTATGYLLGKPEPVEDLQ